MAPTVEAADDGRLLPRLANPFWKAALREEFSFTGGLLPGGIGAGLLLASGPSGPIIGRL